MRSFLHHFDYSVTAFIQQWPSFHGVMLAVTHWGHPIVAIIIALLVAIAGGISTNPRLILAAGVVFGMLGLSTLLKELLHRDRPITEYVAHMTSHSLSFPSGHAVSATIAYGLLGYLAWHYVPQPWSAIAVVVCGIIILAVGVSRIYLGAHFPSDVVGGWLLGLCGLLVIIFIVKP